MKTIAIPSQSVVIAIGGKRAPFAEVLDLVPAPARPWNVDRPDESGGALQCALDESGRARVAMPRAHAKAVKDAARIARRNGAVSVLLRLPGAPDVADATEWVDQRHDVAGPEDLAFEIVPMACDMTHIGSPLDFVGDIHGCHEEATELLRSLGHIGADGRPAPHAQGRTAVLLGDYTDRGPFNKLALELARDVTRAGGLAILGNHDAKLLRWLQGKDVRVASGLEATIAELSLETPEWRAEMAAWLATLQPHLVLDGGRIVAAHAGISQRLQGKLTPEARDFALYGDVVPGQSHEERHPEREDWARRYSGRATVVHGHIAYREPRVLNDVVAIDTGCVFGGKLTAFRWPERTFESVPAKRTYCERAD